MLQQVAHLYLDPKPRLRPRTYPRLRLKHSVELWAVFGRFQRQNLVWVEGVKLVPVFYELS